MKLIIISIFLIGILMTGCSDSVEPTSENIQFKEAVIRWMGEYAVDGCGFAIEIDSKMYKATNESILDDKYKKNNPVTVYLKFRYLDEKVVNYCGDLPLPQKTDGIEILDIFDFGPGDIIGEWEWVESSGGIAGITLVPETQGYTQTYHFVNDSLLDIYKNDSLFLETTYKLKSDTLEIAAWPFKQLIEYKENRLMLADQCVDCFTNVFECKGTDPELLRPVAFWPIFNLRTDPVEIRDVSVSGDNIDLEIGFSGCVGHDFELFAPSTFMESNPVQARLELYHKSSYDMCGLYTTRTISFNLVPLKELYQQYCSEHGKIILNISVLGDSTIFNNKPTYEF